MRKLLFAALFLLAAAAGPPVWFTNRYQHSAQVNQQSPPQYGTTVVTNPTACVWNVDDAIERGTFDGMIPAGGSTTDTTCYIGDWVGYPGNGFDGWPRRVTTDLLTRTQVTVRITYAPEDPVTWNCHETPAPCGGVSFTVMPFWDAPNHAWRYQTCSVAPSYARNDPALQPIPNSNGGVGVMHDITITVTNTTSRKVELDGYWMVGGRHWTNSLCGDLGAFRP